MAPGKHMPTAHDSLLERITIDSSVRFGKPCIRGHRVTVQEILEWLSSGVSQQQILADYPQLEPDDFLAVYAYAADLGARPSKAGWRLPKVGAGGGGKFSRSGHL